MRRKPPRDFFYTEKENSLHGLELPRVCREAMARATRAGFKKLSEEDYWLKLGRYMMTHCPKGYVRWDDQSFWVICAGDANIYDPKDNDGLHLVGFSDRTLSYRWLSSAAYADIRDEDREVDAGGLCLALYSLAYTPWDWLLEGAGDEEMFPLSAAVVQAIEDGMSWTQGLHEKMAKKYPPEKYWA
jgi:hypothetical protein